MPLIALPNRPLPSFFPSTCIKLESLYNPQTSGITYDRPKHKRDSNSSQLLIKPKILRKKKDKLETKLRRLKIQGSSKRFTHHKQLHQSLKLNKTIVSATSHLYNQFKQIINPILLKLPSALALNPLINHSSNYQKKNNTEREREIPNSDSAGKEREAVSAKRSVFSAAQLPSCRSPSCRNRRLPGTRACEEMEIENPFTVSWGLQKTDRPGPEPFGFGSGAAQVNING